MQIPVNLINRNEPYYRIEDGNIEYEILTNDPSNAETDNTVSCYEFLYYSTIEGAVANEYSL